MHFTVGSKSLVMFKVKLYVKSVNSSFQSLPIICHKELLLRCCIELDPNILTWWTKWSYHQLFGINYEFIINVCVGDIQLLCYHKMPKYWTYLPSCLHLFNFGSPLPPSNIVNLTLTSTHHHYHYHLHHQSQKNIIVWFYSFIAYCNQLL